MTVLLNASRIYDTKLQYFHCIKIEIPQFCIKPARLSIVHNDIKDLSLIAPANQTVYQVILCKPGMYTINMGYCKNPTWIERLGLQK